jgi:glycine betaine/choline ABC-type transport system substrate-binding protein
MLAVTWRGHSCLLRPDSSGRFFPTQQAKGRDESGPGRQSAYATAPRQFCAPVVLVIALALAGCSNDRHLSIGAKNFTEQTILGEIIAQHIENRLHQPVERKLGLGGTMLAQQALLTKEIDLYPEYTGTAFTNIMKHQPLADPARVLEQLRQDYGKLGLQWLDPLGFDNSFAIVVRGEDARSRHLETLSDAGRDPKGFTLGAGYEFLTRRDGFDLLTHSYGIKWIGVPKSMDLGLLYQALKQKQVDMAAGSATDGVLTVLDAKVLQDGKHVFPPYQACIVVRSDSLAATPNLWAVLSELSGKISTESMRQMNYQVDGKHRPASEVAAEFLKAIQLRHN